MSDRDQLVRRHQPVRLAMLVRASRVFAEAVPDYEHLLKTVAEHVSTVTGDACTIRLLAEDGTYLQPVACHYPDVELQAAMWEVMRQTTERADFGLWKLVIEERRTFCVSLQGSIPPEVSDAQAAFLRRYPVRGIIAAPLLARGRVLGGISLVRYDDGEPFSSADEAFLQDLAERAALAIDNARLYGEARAQLETLRAVVEHAPDIISRFDRNGRHLYVNPAVEAAMRLPASAMIGKSNRELGMPEPFVAYWELALDQVFRTGRERTIEFSFPGSAGERHYQARIAPEFGPDGSVLTVLAVARDITDQKKVATEREELYRELLERDRRLHELISRQLVDRERDERRTAAIAEIEPMTLREHDILRLVADGLTNQQIGRRLRISPKTVKNHVARLLKKLGAPDRTAAAVRAIELGLVERD